MTENPLNVIKDKHLLSVPTRTLDPPISLVDRAREIELADASIKTHVHGKLDIIARQIQALKKEAEAILEQAELDAELHRVRCNFEKKVGQIIYLYEKGPMKDTFFIILRGLGRKTSPCISRSLPLECRP